jgi:TRAP-type C4-dicarboxylate transport system, small permease component
MLFLMILLVWDFVGRGIPGTIMQLGEYCDSQALKNFAQAAWLQPISILADLSVFIMIAGVYLGLALCEENDQHVCIEALPTLLRGKPRQFFLFLSAALQEITVIIMLYAMYRNTVRSYTNSEAVSGLVPLEIWPVKVVVLFGLALYFLQLSLKLYDKSKTFFNPQMTD